MKRFFLAVAAMAAVAVPGIALQPVALASSPTSGTLSYGSPASGINWSGSALAGSAASRRQVTCNATPPACDNFALTIDTRQNGAVNHLAQVDITIVPSAGAQMSIVVYAPPDCTPAPTTAAPCYSASGTQATLVDPVNGLYTIQVACTACAGASYTANAKLTTRTITVPPPCVDTAPCFPVSAATNLGPAGGEPSLQDDGAGNIYITTPQGTGSAGTGVRFSHSADGGRTFARFADLPYKDVGGAVGGSDSDVVVDSSRKNLYIADLAAADATILRSQDQGLNFPQSAPAGPENDRQWLTTVGPNVYLTYHDFVGNIPLIFGSTDGGATFPPGLGFAGTGQIFAPTDTGFAEAKCNTLVGKPVADAAGTLYILTNTSTVAENAAAACATSVPLDRFYMSVSTDGGHTFTSSLVSDLSATGNPGQAVSGSWGHVFNQLAIDNGGNLYIDASGTLDGVSPVQNYLLVSKDHGKTFSRPILTNAHPRNAQLFPAIAAGQAGQVAVGYYQGLLPDYRAAGSMYQFIIDETFNALDARPTFTHTQLTPLKGNTPHPDGICTDGAFCISPTAGGDRKLADFESMTVSERGNLEVILPAVADGSTTENWFYRQTSGPLLVPGPTNGNGTGNQTYVAGARTAAPPSPAVPVAPSVQPPPALPNTSGNATLQRSSGAAALVIFAVAAGAGAGLRRRFSGRSKRVRS
ncbi:MAG: hypothetical protein NVSMB17_13270 [Candidatus Dormibacteria bacterium]